MNPRMRITAAMSLAICAGMPFLGHAAAVEEIVVYGTRTTLAMDTAALRIDVPSTVRALSVSVQRALAGNTRETSPDVEVATADNRTRG